MARLVAFTGFARAGKDVAAQCLIDSGYKRVAFGDIIKKQIDPMVQQHLGFSAFTEDDSLKIRIRPLMELWGDLNYFGVMREFFDTLPERAVNTRLVRTQEAAEWRKRGGIIVHIKRPGSKPASNWEQDRLWELYNASLIDRVIENDGDVEALWSKILQLSGP